MTPTTTAIRLVLLAAASSGTRARSSGRTYFNESLDILFPGGNVYAVGMDVVNRM